MGGPAYVGGRYLKSTDNFLEAPFRFPCTIVVTQADGNDDPNKKEEAGERTEGRNEKEEKQVDVEWKTCEHLYQAMKFDSSGDAANKEIREYCLEIQQADGPIQAWDLGQSRKYPVRKNWYDSGSTLKGHAMYLAVRAKYDQYPTMAKELVETYGQPIRAAPSTADWEYLNSIVLERVRLELKMKAAAEEDESKLSDTEWDKKQRREMAELAEYKRLCKETSLPAGSSPIKIYLPSPPLNDSSTS